MKVMKTYIHIGEGRKTRSKASLPYKANHRVVQILNPMELHKMLPSLLKYALIHPLKGDAEAMGKSVKALFNIHNPPLVVINQVKADVPIPSLYTPQICH